MTAEESAPPKFHKPWPVLLALEEKVKQQLDKQEMSKCQFLQGSQAIPFYKEFLWHSISRGSQANQESCYKHSIEAPTPTKKQKIQSFLGILTYNAKVLPNMSHTLHPLNQLLWKTHPGCGKPNNTKLLKLQNAYSAKTQHLHTMVWKELLNSTVMHQHKIMGWVLAWHI